MSEDPDLRRHALLAELVPPLVHRLNNLLAVAGGHADVWAARRGGPDAAFPEQIEQVRGSVLEAARLLGALSDLARPARPDVEAEARLGPALDAVRGLATPFGDESGVAFTAEAIGGDGVLLTGPRRLQRALQVAVLGAIAGLTRSAAADRRVRLRALVGPDRVALALTARGPLDASSVERVRADLAPLGVVRVRRRGDARAWRAVVAARCRVEPAGVVAARRRAAVLLVEPDDLLADLVASVLREDGFRVAVAAGLAAAESSARGAGILLLASSAAQRDRVRALRLTARFPRVLLLGEPLPGFGGADDALAKPFRPDQLVRVVAELGERG